MRTQSRPDVGFGLTVASHRQIIAAITHRHGRMLFNAIQKRMKDEQDAFASQMGHSIAVNTSRYGRDQGRIPTTDEVTLDMFREATVTLQFFIGAIDRLPDWFIDPSKIIFPAGPGSYILHKITLDN